MAASRRYNLETQRLLLRQATADDLDLWAARIYADPDVMRYMPRFTESPRERVQKTFNLYNKLWAEHNYGGWLITDKADGQLIGHCALEYLEDTDEVDLGYTLAKAYWGNGIATEAARACVRFGFETAGVDRMMAVVIPDNGASWRILERLGFTFEKKARYYDFDVRYYAITRAQFHPGDTFYAARLSPGFDDDSAT